MNYKNYVVFSFAVAIVHFICETVWHFLNGQYLPMLIVDYISIGLLLYACYESKYSELYSRVLFVGAWGFTFCLFYRALFSRLESINNIIESLNLTVVYVGFLMLISGLMFVYGIVGARNKVHGM